VQRDTAGLLLLRVRDEIRMTVASYQTLYESAIAFAMRKALQSEQSRAELTARIRQQVRLNASVLFCIVCIVCIVM
jgi:hypothetical protein